MDPVVKLEELKAQLKELKAKRKEQSLPGGKVSEIHPILTTMSKKRKEELREAYRRNRKPRIFDLRRNSSQQQDPPPVAPMLMYSLGSMSVSDDFSEDEEGKEA